MSNSLHLLFPLASSFLFVVGAMFAKRASVLGVGPFSLTLGSNFLLAVCWAVVGIARNDWLLVQSGWPAMWPAIWIAASFVIGQLCTFLAFRLGDVSLATPVFGVKIILVALISSLLAQQAIAPEIWCAAALATLGVIVIQSGTKSLDNKLSAGRAAWSIVLALMAATSLSLFDVGVQVYGPQFGALRFLTTMFMLVGLLSFALLPWSDRFTQMKKLRALQPLSTAAFIMTLQAISITYALGQYGDATRVNIVYSLRGLWSVLLAWALSRLAMSPEANSTPRTLVFRLVGAILLMVSVLVALSAGDRSQ